MKVEIGRVKIPKKSSNLLDASKKLFKILCHQKDILKYKKLYTSTFYIKETTKGSKKKVYGPYKGTVKFNKVDSNIKKPIFKVVKLNTRIKLKGGEGDYIDLSKSDFKNDNYDYSIEILKDPQLNIRDKQLIIEILKDPQLNIRDKQLIIEILNYPELKNIYDKQLIIECFKENPSYSIIENLKNKGANINVQYKNGVTPLMLIVNNCSNKKYSYDYKYYFENNKRPYNNINNNFYNLYVENKSGEFDEYKKKLNVLKKFLKLKPDVNVVTPLNNTALYIAIQREDINIIQLLLNEGAKTEFTRHNIPNKTINLIEITQNKHIKALLEKGPTYISRIFKLFSFKK